MKKSKLGQFYTPDNISKLMAKLITSPSTKEPLNIIDMACGTGSLLTPLQKILPNSNFEACDIDSENIEYLNKKHPNWDKKNINALSQEFKKEFYDIAVGNPPFIKTKTTSHIANLIERNYESTSLKNSSTVRAEIVFIAKYIESTKIGGMVSLIIPESIVSNEKMKFVRTFIFKNLSNIRLYEISSRYFDSAEVKTYLISGRKTVNPDHNISIGHVTANGDIIDDREISKKFCIERADIKYLSHLEQIKEMRAKYLSLGDLTSSINRGNKTKNQLEKENTVFFHTSSFKEFTSSNIELEGNLDLIKKYSPKHVAQKSDILIPRIGRKCHQHQVFISEGNAVVTDSVFRLNVPESLALKVFDALQTEENQFWRDLHSKGSCTKLLTTQDIFNMPLVGLTR
ncbi:N-6 DNA methylase [Thiomicrorhabdus xiamenensis]|uniref:site-specific DNA-methyltransferase (adenine-specific) n=1 Tax=Thiomicrorhabdus xiamenensis TaxID=2739063 RepID=A0A7D4NSL0_9GAMM|nr:N-6 DNA methylase [Thiomicrorhabdus xiamenensis]QKI90057.1 N-6 DNA methylase [Thiomicrorhabdus xiamenensis]